jgi:hypothetical protein
MVKGLESFALLGNVDKQTWPYLRHQAILHKGKRLWLDHTSSSMRLDSMMPS